MSDIGIDIPWWVIAFGLLATIFWPLTAVTAAALLWLLRYRASVAARIIAIGALLVWSASAYTNVMMLRKQAQDAADYQSALRARQTTLHEAAVIEGMHLPAGTVLTRGRTQFDNGVAAI